MTMLTGKLKLEDYNSSVDRYRQKIQALQLETRENQQVPN